MSNLVFCNEDVDYEKEFDDFNANNTNFAEQIEQEESKISEEVPIVVENLSKSSKRFKIIFFNDIEIAGLMDLFTISGGNHFQGSDLEKVLI